MYKRLERGGFSSVAGGAVSENDRRLVLEGIDLKMCRLIPALPAV